MVEVPYAKGYYGVDYRTLLGLHRNVGTASSAMRPNDPAWDLWVAGLPFLLAPSEANPYTRVSNPLGRDRFDSARDAGENSLDSSLWLRSWTSWHLGAGQVQAEPLELSANIARFRFDRSAGIDPWTAGQVTLQRKMLQVRASGVNAVLGMPGVGLLEARSTGVWLNGTQIYSGGAITKIAAGGNRWAGITPTGTVAHGRYDGTDTGTVSGLTGVTVVGYQKNRFWAVDGPDTLREVPDPKGSLPPAIKFNGARKIIDVDSGVAGVYVMTDEGLTNIHVIGADETGALTAPVNVATLPRGENGKFLYGYLGRYLAIGSTHGVRIADSGTAQSLPIGPLIIETPAAPADITADGNSLWVTTALNTIDTIGDGSVMRPGTYRIDLSRLVDDTGAYGDTAAARFAYATDQYAEVSGIPVSLSTYNGLLYLVLADGQEWGTDPSGAQVDYGWLETGEVTFSTGEMKTWDSVFADAVGDGAIGLLANSGGGWNPVTQNLIPLPVGGAATIDSHVNPPSTALNLRVALKNSPGGLHQIVLRALSLRALPASKRTRRITLPLLCFDREVDRSQSPIGYDGFAYDRIHDVESLEGRGSILQVLDTRTNETINCQIDKITFEARTPPDRALKNWGGLLTLVLLVM